MVETITEDVTKTDLKGVVSKLLPDATAKDIEKASQGIYPLHDVYIRKVRCVHICIYVYMYICTYVHIIIVMTMRFLIKLKYLMMCRYFVLKCLNYSECLFLPGKSIEKAAF